MPHSAQKKQLSKKSKVQLWPLKCSSLNPRALTSIPHPAGALRHAWPGAFRFPICMRQSPMLKPSTPFFLSLKGTKQQHSELLQNDARTRNFLKLRRTRLKIVKGSSRPYSGYRQEPDKVNSLKPSRFDLKPLTIQPSTQKPCKTPEAHSLQTMKPEPTSRATFSPLTPLTLSSQTLTF